ncbi:MAG: hypothetical protein GY938_32880 [Ketobacter sp.]|nr:hypothetical protein [Ketobacter sp.]
MGEVPLEAVEEVVWKGPGGLALDHEGGLPDGVRFPSAVGEEGFKVIGEPPFEALGDPGGKGGVGVALGAPVGGPVCLCGEVPPIVVAAELGDGVSELIGEFGEEGGGDLLGAGGLQSGAAATDGRADGVLGVVSGGGRAVFAKLVEDLLTVGDDVGEVFGSGEPCEEEGVEEGSGGPVGDVQEVVSVSVKEGAQPFGHAGGAAGGVLAAEGVGSGGGDVLDVDAILCCGVEEGLG